MSPAPGPRETVDIEAEIAAAKVRLGYQPDEPVDGPTVCAELPERMHRAFWERQVDRLLTQLEAEAGIVNKGR